MPFWLPCTLNCRFLQNSTSNKFILNNTSADISRFNIFYAGKLPLFFPSYQYTHGGRIDNSVTFTSLAAITFELQKRQSISSHMTRRNSVSLLKYSSNLFQTWCTSRHYIHTVLLANYNQDTLLRKKFQCFRPLFYYFLLKKC